MLPPHPFDRSGLAARSDLETAEWRAVFERLERRQADFLAREREFRSPEYAWPRDPLHTWSRCWEYPYAYHQVRTLREGWTAPRPPRVLDLGSGVTFFPFAVAALGVDVLCIDPDPLCERDLSRAVPVVEHAPGHVEARGSDGVRIPLADATMDAVLCVSVLEHVPDFPVTVAEIARVLASGGLFVLTVDLELGSGDKLPPDRYQILRDRLSRDFDLAHPETTLHPRDVLRSTEGRYPLSPPRGRRLLEHLLRQRIAAPLRGRRPAPGRERLAVAAFTLRRRG